jgi:hypothetical protein
MLLCMSVNATILILVFKYVTTDSIISNTMAGRTGTALGQAGVQLAINICMSFVQALSACCGVVIGKDFHFVFIGLFLSS